MIYHLALPAAWEAALAAGSYDRSTREQSFAEVGYIHCSTREQLPGTIAKFYSDLRDVVLLTIDETGLDVRYDAVGDARFPHLYSELPVGAVVQTQSFSPASGQPAPVEV